MKLSELIRGILSPDITYQDTEITLLTEQSGQAAAHSLLVCIRGARFDGHDHAWQAYENGCRHFVAERPLSLPDDAIVFTVSSTRRALALLSCRFYGDPSHRLRVVAITGTKGKTTTAHLLSHILNQNGIPCGYIGTNGISYGDVQKDSKNTTPDAITLQKTLCEMLDAGMQAVVLEVSSQALYQYRADGMRIECAIFTNLSPDHIGTNEHPDLAHYEQCKLRLFSEFSPSTVICNADDAFTDRIKANSATKRLITCSIADKPADWHAYEIHPLLANTHMGIAFRFSSNNENGSAELSLAGDVNASNALLALAAAKECFGISAARASIALKSATVTGRSEILALPNGAYVVIDYAHNGTSLSQLLRTLRSYAQKRLLCLFGSIGGRAQIRRRELALAAAQWCDLSILTSDNPANEDPEAILDDIAAAYEETGKPYLRICDRAKAIREAVKLTQKGDILVLAGKGHETYQLIHDTKIAFCEREIVESTYVTSIISS